MTDTQELNDALASNYMLVRFTLRTWGAKATDEAASNEIVASKGATRGSAKVVKNLLAGADAELKLVQQLGTSARAFVYANTLPWSDATDGAKKGDRLINALKTFGFLKELNTIVQDYNAAVAKLKTVWDQRVAEAVSNLNGMGDLAEYPSSDELVNKFGITVDVMPVPSQRDFSRTTLPPELAQALGERHAKMLEARADGALSELKKRMLDELKRMADQLGKAGRGDKTRLYDSLVTNLQGLVDLARSMNVHNNPELAALADRIETQLLSKPVEAYKSSPELAATTSNIATQLAVDAAIEEVWK